MLTLIKNAKVFAPEDLGRQDILISDRRIAAIQPNISVQTTGVDVHTIDAEGRIVTPCFVDPLAHFNGGGGEGGFHTRTPVMPISDAVEAGIGTMVSGLGTDATTRTLVDMLAHAHGLEHKGLTTYCYTGSYQYPVKTITDSIRDDIILIDKFIGIGELAIADKRGSQLTTAELARVASEAKVGGLLSGKAGIVFLHVGDEAQQLNLVEQTARDFDVDLNQFHATHINRHAGLVEQGGALASAGLMIDLTCSTTPELIAEGEIPAALCAAQLLNAGVPIERITLSTDANASLPDFDKHGKLRGLKVGKARSLLDAFQQCINEGVTWQDAVAIAATNTARNLRLSKKGRLSVGSDADLNIFCPDSLALQEVFYGGSQVMKASNVVLEDDFSG